LTLWLWPWCLNYLFETLIMSISFEWYLLGLLIFYMTVPCDKTFLMVPIDLTLWLWPWCLTYLLKTLTMIISFEWYILWLRYFT
jgi:hypothetical protein